jgi:heme o synthase
MTREATLASRELELAAGSAPALLASWRDYAALTKPRIMTLLLLTGAAGMFAGAGNVPRPTLLVVTLLGLGLACGGASAVNHVLDRDIDRLMGSRTCSRPVAAGRISPARALAFGISLSAISFAVLALAVNLLAALLALAGGLFYVFVYTVFLKRRSAQNIVIGGAAGAFPPLVGWAAATGSITPSALVLFGIVFLWTPPHFWALALLLERNYAAAGIPMLPVVRGRAVTTREILAYSAALVALTLAPVAWGQFGVAYLFGAILLDARLLQLAWRLRADPTSRNASSLFHYSLVFLALLFTTIAVDTLIS